MMLHSYDIEEFNFKSHFQKIFDCVDLNNMHNKYDFKETFTMGNNSDTFLHDRFYNDMRNDDHFINLYENFVNKYVTRLFREEFIFQRMPTLRIHFVDNWATPEFHVDTQDGYFHPHGENNFILPLTTCFDTNSLWVETEPNKGDYTPVKMSYGNLLQFSGGTHRHGNKINKTAFTRVSFDFRVLPLSKYDPNFIKTSATKGVKFVVGGYYKELR
jgi:hypothetical protein